jgi:hypothetical protein
MPSSKFLFTNHSLIYDSSFSICWSFVHSPCVFLLEEFIPFIGPIPCKLFLFHQVMISKKKKKNHHHLLIHQIIVFLLVMTYMNDSFQSISLFGSLIFINEFLLFCSQSYSLLFSHQFPQHFPLHIC